MTATSPNKVKWLNKTIVETAKRHGLNPVVVMSMCAKESSFDTHAMRFEPGWKWFLNPAKWAKIVSTTKRTEEIGQMISWGLMQVMGTVAREHGFAQDFPRLSRVDQGLLYGCLHLKKLLLKYPLPEALAAYNAGIGNRNSKVGKAYADHVLSLMEGYRVLLVEEGLIYNGINS